jgi:hypothetical protein
MVAGLPVSRFNLGHPVLVDAFAMGVAVAAAVVAEWSIPGAVVLAVVAGCVKEAAPVFAAAYAWNPWLLLAMVAPAIRALWKTGPDVLDEKNRWILDHPFRAGREAHKGLWLRGIMLAPWGGAIVGFAGLDWHLAVVLVLGYGQLLVATDTVRLYQWAAPTLCVAAVGAVPEVWLPVLVVWTVWNPLAGDGV